MNETYERIAAELQGPLTRRKPADHPRTAKTGRFAEDYGFGKRPRPPEDFHPGLPDVDSGHPSHPGRLVEAYQYLRCSLDTFRSEVAEWCIGTKVFIVSVGIATFILVV